MIELRQILTGLINIEFVCIQSLTFDESVNPNDHSSFIIISRLCPWLDGLIEWSNTFDQLNKQPIELLRSEKEKISSKTPFSTFNSIHVRTSWQDGSEDVEISSWLFTDEHLNQIMLTVIYSDQSLFRLKIALSTHSNRNTQSHYIPNLIIRPQAALFN